MKKLLQYNDANMWSAACGAGGAHRAELKALQSKLRDAKAALDHLRLTDSQGWFNLPYDEKLAISLMLRAKEVKRNFTDLIVIGIGGSNLGAKAIWQALGHEAQGVKLHFLDNPDPEVLAYWTRSRKVWKKTAINVISKSGSTLETMSIFMLLRHELIKAVGEANHAKHIWVTTDPGQGILQQIAKDNKYRMIDHPLTVGGRFSVLSSVGLFPAACAGLDARKILKGAKAIERAHRRQGIKHPVATFAALHYLAMKKRGQKIHVLMPYADRLKDFGLWYRQLWAESLGKRGKGPTPVTASGPVDQHSQLQLYQDGPKDKILTFLEVATYRQSVSVPKAWSGASELDYLRGLDFSTIMQSELSGTAQALAHDGRPSGTLRISEISEESLGALFQFYELATAYLGELMGINAYDQPGVEQSKINVQAILNKL
ncbi:glucose-6-phosphate isomerase [Patescibacteria group bacterium]|nr:glucose-6-phosphate isomerase [Patescibacteria group bacterium]MBU1705325.1 glucose-6-phosphate isomerase [Patescibacteria group bacterium]